MRFFRADPQTYESARAALDAALGYPSDSAETCIDPADVGPRDTLGRVLVAVSDNFLGVPPVAAAVEALVRSGVEEIDAETFAATMAREPQP